MGVIVCVLICVQLFHRSPSNHEYCHHGGPLVNHLCVKKGLNILLEDCCCVITSECWRGDLIVKWGSALLKVWTGFQVFLKSF